jgi:rhamnosyltransferase
MRSAACVVLYNPDDSMLLNIRSYADNVERLILVDNSPISNNVFYEYAQSDPKFTYTSFGENMGIAYALNHASQLAFDEGYDWILTMDQDSRFIDGSFFGIVEDESGKPQNSDVAVYAASYMEILGRWSKPFDSYFDEVHFAVTSGNFVHLKKWKDAGGFEEKLFIDEVDHDFCIKLRLLNYRIITSKRIFMNHTVGVAYDVDSAVTKTRARPQPLRFYYITRNGLLMVKRYLFKDFPFAFNRFFYLNKALLRILLLYPEKKEYIKYFFLGIRDFFRSKFGKLSQPGK